MSTPVAVLSVNALTDTDGALYWSAADAAGMKERGMATLARTATARRPNGFLKTNSRIPRYARLDIQLDTFEWTTHVWVRAQIMPYPEWCP